jgi:hypothetical protein
LTRCPQATFEATIEAAGKLGHGYSGDCLPPGWFDKSPGKGYAQQIDDMLAVIAVAELAFREELAKPIEFFPAWRIGSQRVHEWADERKLPPLLASFGASMVERALIDAMARLAGVPFHQAVRDSLLAIRPGDVHPPLAGHEVAEWLPRKPSTSVFVRHTVGLADPLTTADIPTSERLADGLPQSLEQYLEHSEIRYLKIKLANSLARDVERLEIIALLVERFRGHDYWVTLDGNEQYKQADQLEELFDAIGRAPALATMRAHILAIEQPLDRAIALDEAHTGPIRKLAQTVPVIIDESDGDLNAYGRALAVGYRGVSSKNCKGPMRSLLNAGLTWLANGQGQRQEFVMTGEDLCTVGIIPVQSDLCLAASLGLAHVERNGHHYHRGLSYLPEHQQRAALRAHGDLYGQQHGIVGPRVVQGQFQIGSLQCPGFGFAVLPDFGSLELASEWSFDSLGI